MVGQLAALLEEATGGFTAPVPAPTSYRDQIRTVAVSGVRIQSGHNASTFSSNSGASSSYLSSISGCSSGSASACVVDLATCELSMLARQMVSDGYTQRMVQEFDMASSVDRALENWLFELDVDWVLQFRKEHGLCQQLQDKSSSLQHDLVERWIRALIVIGYSMRELGDVVNKTPAMARFAKASISAMLVFVDTMVHIFCNLENLDAMLHTLICINATYWDVPMYPVFCSEASSILEEIGDSLDKEGDRLWVTISSMIEEVKAPMEDDDLWAVEILRGGGGLHRNTRLMMDCVMSMRQASASMSKSAGRCFTLSLLIDDTIHYLKDLLQRKSQLCSDPSLMYLFLLNNSYFIAKMSQPPRLLNLELRSGINCRGLQIGALLCHPECDKYIDSYLDVSWGHVLSCISQSKISGLLHRWVNTSSRNSLAEFKSAFHKTYQAQKFWKVPDPQLRDALRKSIAERVISAYCNYLKEHPELEKYIGDEASNPEVLEEMLGELFEG